MRDELVELARRAVEVRREGGNECQLLKVIMYNLPLEGEQVRFESEPLRSADLFSIVGETGSGKSTILDAVCLALYGLAPRFYGADNFDYYHTERPNNDQVLDPDDPRNDSSQGQ